MTPYVTNAISATLDCSVDQLSRYFCPGPLSSPTIHIILPAVGLLRRCSPETAVCAGLAEFYATLTRLPAPNRASPQQARRFIENIEQRLGFVSLTSEEYRNLIRLAASEGIAGGALYDYLIASCAIKAGADTICTWNTKHYRLFGPEIVGKLRVPEAAP